MGRSWTSKKALIIGTAGAAMVLAACAGAIAYGFVKATGEVGEGKAVMTAVLRSIAEKDYRTAYSHFSEELQAEGSLHQFAEMLDAQQSAYAGFMKLTTTGWNIEVASSEKSRLTYSAAASFADGSKVALEAILLRESGVWKVRAFQMDRSP